MKEEELLRNGKITIGLCVPFMCLIMIEIIIISGSTSISSGRERDVNAIHFQFIHTSPYMDSQCFFLQLAVKRDF